MSGKIKTMSGNVKKRKKDNLLDVRTNYTCSTDLVLGDGCADEETPSPESIEKYVEGITTKMAKILKNIIKKIKIYLQT